MSTTARIFLACGLAATLGAAPSARAHVDVPGLDINGQCVGDSDGNAAVTINELILAVNNALDGCADRPVEIQFKGTVGEQAFACGGSFSDIGTGHSPFLPSDFRFYVSNVRLVTPGGSEVPVALDQDGIWQYQDVALIDFEDGSGPCAFGNQATNTSVRGTVPAGVYSGVKFDLGVPFELNHGNAATAPAPLNFSAMFWSWRAGYKFLRLDTAGGNFNFHVGSTGCQSEGSSQPPISCSAPNLATVALNGFDPERSIIVADLKSLLSQSDIGANTPDTDPGCQSSPIDPDCGPLFNSLGLDFPAGAPIAGQRFFRVESSALEDVHRELFVGSSEENGGTLILLPEFDPNDVIPAFVSGCLGGTGAECTGGTRVFTTVNPGVEPLTDSEPDEPLYTLADGTAVTLEVTAIDDGLTMRLDGTPLDSAGDSVLLGSSPDCHADFEAQLALPGGEEPSGTYSVSLKVTSRASAYQPSSELTLTFTPTE